MQKVTAFVARSFDELDEPKIQPVLKFLDSFKNIGFFWETAERAEMESVSKKVRRLIDDSDVLVAILTARNPIYALHSDLATAWKLWRGELQPHMWTAPAWVLQELGYALGAGRKLLLLREPLVEIPRLPGDLEYIDYNSLSPAVAFQRVNEMIHAFIAERSAISIETSVRVSPAPAEPQIPEGQAATTEVEANIAESPRTEPSYATRLTQICEALETGNVTEANSLFETGLQRIKEERPGRDLIWHGFFQRARFDAGFPDGLEELINLQAKNPSEPFLASMIADCYLAYGQSDKAAEFYGQAASIAKGDSRASFLIRSARCLMTLGRNEESFKILLDLSSICSGERRFEVLQLLYEVLKGIEPDQFAFGIAELTLYENPALSSFRFSLGLDYRRSKQTHLFLHSYKVICDHDLSNSSAVHNLALAYDDSSLPILSVSSYKDALKLGNSLSGNNLAYRHLDAGFADEAIEKLRMAQQFKDCVADVQICLGDIENRRKLEAEKLNSILEQVAKQRSFLVKLGSAVLSTDNPNITGAWDFAFGRLTLQHSGDKLKGLLRREVEEPPSPIMKMLNSKAEPIKFAEEYRFSGRLRGRACKFRIEKHRKDPVAVLLGSEDLTTTDGFLIFAPDGKSAEVGELVKDNLEKYYTVLSSRSAS